ncbi:Calpain family cysteine protease [Lasiodiplodia theobromae]|uniref:Calpain family cysteine protease n=1 Tax=Lasiodiplodia theobromae TaxID=45133 RepID=UPI0015C2F55B|nr:Calpain family cysteine protease [Lasiodiplodia theobromae]KAF4546552.1 Calpain family cysteine protease [Lasiodiplodia theobromae]
MDYYYQANPAADAASVAGAPKKKKHAASKPQKALDEYWDKFITKTPGKVTRIFPPSLYASLLPHTPPKALSGDVSATASYEAAKEACKRKVQRIVRECKRTNEKWSDPDFDIESDFDTDTGNCLHGLVEEEDNSSHNIDTDDLKSALNTLTSVPGLLNGVQEVSVPGLLGVLQNDPKSSMPVAASVHRIGWIYDKPAFTINGFGVSDVQQGGTGDCWWVAAVATLCSMPGQMERICVARDEKCGVYGFVFHRDGEWVPVVVDDNLYLARGDYDSVGGAGVYDPTGKEARQWKEREQTGSEALAFAKCADPNETWLPLLEKAYAKIHGDYDAIAGGFPGEGVEDMTGGVTTTIDTNKILDKDVLWEELLNVNKDFIFAIGTPGSAGGDSDTRSGLAYQHAYSVLKAVEEEDQNGKKFRLVRIRNPWGRRNWMGEGEWNGPWSDGSKEWNGYWLNKLDHQFGDDGIFWMSFDDMLNRFNSLDRTRLFCDGWSVAQQWTSINVSWMSGYINAKFVVEIKEGGLFVFVLSKLDDRYFKGLEGQYDFELHFILQEAGSEIGDHIARVRPSSAGSWQRAVSAEVELEPGTYEVIPKILATKDDEKDLVEDVVKKLAKEKPQKLRQIGLNYDFAHLKAVPPPAPPKEPTGGKSSSEGSSVVVVNKEAEKGSGDEAKKEQSTKPAEEEAKPETKATEEKTEPETKATEEKTEPAKKATKETEPANKDTETAQGGEEKAPEIKEEAPSAPKAGESTTEPAKAVEEKKDGPGETKVPEPEPEPASAPPPPPEDPEDSDDEGSDPWNAVCVIGLRVYSRDCATTIRLETPKTVEEGAVLDVDGEATGSTM